MTTETNTAFNINPTDKLVPPSFDTHRIQILFLAIHPFRLPRPVEGGLQEARHLLRLLRWLQRIHGKLNDSAQAYVSFGSPGAATKLAQI